MLSLPVVVGFLWTLFFLTLFFTYSLFLSHSSHLHHQIVFVPLGLQIVLIIGSKIPTATHRKEKIKTEGGCNHPWETKQCFPVSLPSSQYADRQAEVKGLRGATTFRKHFWYSNSSLNFIICSKICTGGMHTYKLELIPFVFIMGLICECTQ